MIIREFEEKDAVETSELIKQTFLNVNSKEYPKKTIQRLIEDTSPDKLIKRMEKRHMYVAEEDGKILGIGAYSDDDLHTFFVDHKKHRKGIGRKLLEKVLEEAKKVGVKTMNCASTPYAEKFYASFGFKKIGEKTVEHLGAELHFIEMKKKL